MSTMPHWDEQEAALLIESFLQIEQGEISSKEAIAEISKRLRARAIASGYEIDSSFRNENEIAAQFSKLQRLMQRRPHAELNNMKVIVDMVALYHNQPDRFQTILSGAKESSLKKEEDIFFQWLIADFSGENLSNLQEAYNDAELFAKKKGMVKSSLDEVTSFDKVELISQILEKDRLFRLFHGRQTQNIVYILDQCRQFITEKEESAQTFVENKGLSAEMENSDAKNTAEEKETSKYEEIKIYLLVADENESSEKYSTDKIKEGSGNEKTGQGQVAESILISEKENQDVDSIKKEMIVLPVEEKQSHINESEKIETASGAPLFADNSVGNKLVSNSGLTSGDNYFYKRLLKDDFSRESTYIRYRRMLLYAHIQICRAIYEDKRDDGNRYANDAVDYLNLAYDILGNEINYTFSNPLQKKHIRAWREGKEYIQLRAEYPEFNRDVAEKTWTIIQKYVEQDVSDILNGRNRLFACENDIVQFQKTKIESNPNDGSTEEREQRPEQWPHDNSQSAGISTSNDLKELAGGTKGHSQEIGSAESGTCKVENFVKTEVTGKNGWIESADFVKENGISANTLQRAAKVISEENDDSIELKQIEDTTPVSDEKPVSDTAYDATIEIESIRDPLLSELENRQLEYYDLRHKGGCLWVVGGLDLTMVIVQLNKAYRVDLRYKENGGNATAGREAWWTAKKTHLEAEIETEQQKEQLPKATASAQEKSELTRKKTDAVTEEFSFDYWLKKQSISPRMRESFSQVMAKIDELGSQLGVLTCSIYLIEEPSELEKTWERLCNHDIFDQYQLQNKIVPFAFNKYLEYRWEEEEISPTEEKKSSRLYKDSKAGEISRSIEETNYDLKESKRRFKEWLQDEHRLADATCESVVSAVSKTSEAAEKNGILNRSIFLVTDQQELELAWGKLQKNPKFQEIDRKSNYRFSKATGRYVKFHSKNTRANEKDPITASEGEVSVIDIIPGKKPPQDSENYADADQRGRVEFLDWLKNHGVSSNSARTAAWALTKVSDLATKQGYSVQSLYAIDNHANLEDIRDKILADPEYEKLRRQNTVVNFAFNRYLESRGVDGFVVSRSVSQTQKEIQTRAVPQRQSKVHPGQAEFERWLREQNCPTGTMKAYLRSLDDIEKFLLENGKESRSIYSVRGVSRLNRIRNDLIHNESYEKTCLSKNVLLDMHALNKYISFRKKDSAGAIDEETAERFSDVLRRCFENGFRPNSLIDRNRFKQFYSDSYGSAPSQSDEEIIQILKQIGFLQDERIYVREGSGHSDLLDDIHEDIAATFIQGATCIYYSELYARYQNALAEQLQVFSQDVMKNMLVSTSYGEYRTSKHYFHTRNQTPDADNDIISLMSRSPIPLNYEEIHERLWYIPMDTIKHCLVTTNELVNVAQETYFNAQNLPVSAEELNSIANIIHRQLGQKSFITDQELRSLIEEQCPSAYINTESFTTWGFRNCLAVLLQDRFSFNGPIISEYGNAINTEQAYKEYCQSHEAMTLDELKTFATDVNSGYIYWDAVMDVMIRTSQNDFVRKGTIQFDIPAIDHVLSEMFDGDYLALKNFQLFLHYPPISVQWNSFVLESYVAGYSQDFTLLHSGFTASECCGAVVRKNSTLKDFQDVITDVLAHSDKWKTKADALSLLVDEGYLQRKHYTKIDMILPEAKLLREKYQAEE